MPGLHVGVDRVPRDSRLILGVSRGRVPGVEHRTWGVTTAGPYAGVVDDVAASLSAQGGALQRAFDTWRDLSVSAVNDQFELELAS